MGTTSMPVAVLGSISAVATCSAVTLTASGTCSAGTLTTTGNCNAGTVVTTSIQTSVGTASMVIGDQQTTGVLYLGTTPSGRTGNVILGATTCTTISRGLIEADGGITMGNAKVITLGTPPTLTTTSLGYFQNYPVVNYSGIANGATGYRFSPTTNTSGAFNFFSAGVYHATIDFTIRYTGSPTTVTYIYNLGFSSGTTTGTVTTSTVSTIGSLTQDTRGALQSTTGNNIDFSKSYSSCFTLSVDSFMNLTMNLNTVTLVGGTLTMFVTGTIHRIA
jgi:hypothetical protein